MKFLGQNTYGVLLQISVLRCGGYDTHLFIKMWLKYLLSWANLTHGIRSINEDYESQRPKVFNRRLELGGEDD